MARKKITVVGAGKVGATVTQLLAYKELGDIVLVNRTVEKAKGIALDLMESFPVEGIDIHVTGTGNYKETRASDVVIITAGLPRKEGMSRDSLLLANAKIVGGIAKQLGRYSPQAVMIVVTNPLDVMAYVAWKVSGLRKNKVVGMAGVLDSSRFRSFLAKELKVPGRKVKAMVLGGHGDFMLPLLHQTTVNRVPITKLLSAGKIKSVVSRTVNAGAEIIKLEKDSAYFAPASSVVEMVVSILKDKKTLLPCSAHLSGEYGIERVFLGVPIRLGRRGVEKIIELSLSEEERKHLQNSAKKAKEMIKKAGI